MKYVYNSLRNTNNINFFLYPLYCFVCLTHVTQTTSTKLPLPNLMHYSVGRQLYKALPTSSTNYHRNLLFTSLPPYISFPFLFLQKRQLLTKTAHIHCPGTSTREILVLVQPSVNVNLAIEFSARPVTSIFLLRRCHCVVVQRMHPLFSLMMGKRILQQQFSELIIRLFVSSRVFLVPLSKNLIQLVGLRLSSNFVTSKFLLAAQIGRCHLSSGTSQTLLPFYRLRRLLRVLRPSLHFPPEANLSQTVYFYVHK